MREVIVKTEELSKHFGDFIAVDKVSFQVHCGEIVGYLGPNGAGKTTTIRMLLGLLLPSGGRANVLGFDSCSEAEAIRARVGYMSQKFALYDELTVMENLYFYAGVYGMHDQTRQSEVLDRLGLRQMARERAGSLPIGWRQRLALATAIIHQPKLLFLDEPTSGVDPVARRDFWDLIYTLTDEGVTALVTTHYMDEAEYCGRVGIMHRGRLMAIGAPSELKRDALPGNAWDVFAEPMLEALRAFSQATRVTRVGLAGDHLRVIAPEDIRAEDLQKILLQFDVQPLQIKEVEPSLEDVFLALLGT